MRNDVIEDIPNKILAAVFAMIGGGLGVHKFYLHKPWQGIVYIIFSWTCIPIVIGFIEGLVYLTMTEETFQLKYTYSYISKFNE